MAGSSALVLSAPESLTLLERELGGRSEIVQALVTAPPSKDVRYVLGLLADPANQRKSLADLCVEAKILPGQLLDMVERGTKVRARIVAGQIVAQGTPAVARDVMQKAAPYEDACVECQGVGSTTPDPTAEQPNPTPVPCPTCRGGGRLRYDADPRCRELALDMAGLTSKGSGIIINNTNQVAVAPPAAGMAFDVLQEMMDRMMYGRQAVPESAAQSATDGVVLSSTSVDDPPPPTTS